MASIAILSNPESDGNKSRLERVREYCAGDRDILHIEVERTEDVGFALNRIITAGPEVIVVNGGDGTVQSVLTELFGEGAPDRLLPPIAVLPSGKTNLIAKDLSSVGDPIRALERVMDLARNGLASNVVSRQLISLDDGSGNRPVLGMFLAAGGLADILLFCRHKLYPLGIPNGLAHTLTLVSGMISVVTDWSSRFLPPKPRAIRIQVGQYRMHGRFQVLMVTTLRRLVLTGRAPPGRDGTLQLLAIERRRRTALRSVYETLLGRLGRKPIPGLHLRMGDEIRIEDDRSGVIMDGELFVAAPDKPIVLKPTQSVRFLDLGHAAHAAEPFVIETHARSQPRPQPAAALLSDAG